MTRDELRARCFDALKETMANGGQRYVSDVFVARILDALHGIARLCPIEATEEMVGSTFVEVGKEEYKHALPIIEQKRRDMWRDMSAAGDLTNPRRRSCDH